MKMKPSHFAQLTEALDKLQKEYNWPWQSLTGSYRKSDLSSKRFRWDMLRASKLQPGDSVGMVTGWPVYDYLNDDHIDTALREYFKDKSEWASTK